jgi:polar amino acid transport system permease protein
MPSFALLGFGPQGWAGQFLDSTLITLQVAACSYALGILIGLMAAWAKLAGPLPLRLLAWGYTVIIRAVPMLLLIILLYFAGSAALDTVLSWIAGRPVETSGFLSAVLALGIVQGAYMTEVLRGAIVAIPKGILEAAFSLALPRHITFFKIVVPSMARIALPGMSNLWQNVLKDTALISVVGFSELVTVGKNAAAATQHYIFFLLLTGAIYYAIALCSGVVFRALQNRVDRGYRRDAPRTARKPAMAQA